VTVPGAMLGCMATELEQKYEIALEVICEIYLERGKIALNDHMQSADNN